MFLAWTKSHALLGANLKKYLAPEYSCGEQNGQQQTENELFSSLKKWNRFLLVILTELNWTEKIEKWIVNIDDWLRCSHPSTSKFEQKMQAAEKLLFETCKQEMNDVKFLIRFT